MAILVDLNQICMSNMYAFSGDLKKAAKVGDEKECENIIRHVILSNLIHYKSKFAEYGDFILTADSGNYWREDKFQYYKAGRKVDRKESDMPWDIIFKYMNQIRKDIVEFFPWMLLRLPRTESDDIIAVMMDYFQENELKGVGLYTEPQPVVAISSDTDHTQLQKYSNYRQWCPMKKSYLPKLSKSDLDKFIVEHTVRGDTGDGIPNIFSRESFFVDRVEKERQARVTQPVLDLFFEHGEAAFDKLPPLNKSETPEQIEVRRELSRNRYFQNKEIVSYDYIPDNIRDAIINQYKSYKINGSQNAVLKYFIKHRCRRLMENIEAI